MTRPPSLCSVGYRPGLAISRERAVPVRIAWRIRPRATPDVA